MRMAQPALLVAGILLTMAGCGAQISRATHGLSAFGELKYPRRLQALRLGQSGRAEGRPPLHHRHRRPHHLRQLQQLHSQGRCGPGARPICSTRLMTRALDEPDAVYGLVARSAPRWRPTAAVGDLPAAARGQVRRRRRRSRPTMSSSRFNTLKEKGHPIYRVPLRDVVQGRGARPAHRALQLHRRPRSATCRWSSPACRSSPRPTTPRTSSIRRRSSRRSAPAPTRSATSSPAPTSATSAATTIGPRISPSTAAASISTSCATSTIAIARRAREPQGRRLRSARGVHLARLGHGLRHRRRQGRPADQAHAARREPVRRAGLLPQHAPAQVRRRARAQGARLCLRLRVDQQEHLLRSLHAHRELLRELRHEGHGQAEPGRAGAARAVPRQAAAGGVRASPTRRRCRTARGKTAGCCARPPGCSTRPAGRSRTASASMPRARRSTSSS